MNDALMRHPQHNATFPTAAWELPQGQALRLTVGPGPRNLQVLQGRLWLTRQGTAGAAAEDIWLQSGDEMALESGSEWVAEGWPQARFHLLVPPSACVRRRAPVVSASSAWRRAWPARA